MNLDTAGRRVMIASIDDLPETFDSTKSRSYAEHSRFQFSASPKLPISSPPLPVLQSGQRLFQESPAKCESLAVMKFLSIALLSLDLLAVGVSAATIDSSFSGGGNSNLWNTTANWSPSGVPSNIQYAVTLPGTFNVLLNSARTVESLTIQPQATLTLDTGYLSLSKTLHCDGLLTMTHATGNVGITFNDATGSNPVSITGAGTIRLQDTAHFIYSAEPLITGPDLKIEGYGRNTSTTQWTLQGLVSANVPAQTFAKSLGSIHLQGGRFRAQNGGILDFYSTTLTGEDDATLTVHDGSLIQFTDTSLRDLSLLPADNDASLLNNPFRLAPVARSVTAKDVRNAARFEIPRANASLSLDGTFVNDGEIVFTNDLTGTASVTALDDHSRLEGSGRLLLSEPFKHRFAGSGPNAVLTNGPQHTIEGSGEFNSTLARFENEGRILTDGTLHLRMGTPKTYFINQPGGSLTILPGGTVNAAIESNSGAIFVNHGLLDIRTAANFDAGNNHTLANLQDGNFRQQGGELRLLGTFEADTAYFGDGSIIVPSGALPGQALIRATTLSMGSTTLKLGTNVLSFGKAAPFTPGPSGCTTTAAVVNAHFGMGHLGGAIAEIEIESTSNHGRLSLNSNFVLQGGLGFRFLYTGPTGGLPDGSGPGGISTLLNIVSGASYTYNVSNPDGIEMLCEDNIIHIATVVHGGLIIPLNLGYIQTAPYIYTARVRTWDGRVDFQGNYQLAQDAKSNIADGFFLTDPVFATELTPQPLTFSVPETHIPGTDIATLTKPASMPGTPTFRIIGDSPFAIDPGTGVLTLAKVVDFESGPLTYNVTINIFDDHNVQINPATFSITDVIEDRALCIREILTGPGGPFENQTDPAIISPDADPDGDGLPNFYELWRQTDPATPNPAPSLLLSRYFDGTNTYATLLVTVDSKIDDILGMEGTFSFNLTQFRPGARHVQADNTYTRRLLFVDTAPDITGTVFARLQTDLSTVK